MTLAAGAHHRNLSKKKLSEALDDPDKYLPRDALGIVMITHGEEFGEESLFGKSLVRLGRAHCKVATLQEAFALTFQDTFIKSLERFGDQVKEYEAERKKLETRRLNYDAALHKIDKVVNSKKVKDKDRREAEDEVLKAEERYEETEEDVRARIVAVQENEIDQLRELGAFLDNELNFAEQYVEVLKKTKANWVSSAEISKVEVRRPTGPMHNFVRSADAPAPAASTDAKKPEPSSIRSHRSHGSVASLPKRPPSRPEVATSDSERDSPGGESDDDGNATSRSRKGSRPSSVRTPSRPPSRPSSRSASRTGRKRSDSTATVGSVIEKEREKEKKKINVGGWASSWRGKKDKDAFASLRDDDDDDDEEVAVDEPSRNASVLSFSSNKAKSRSKTTASPHIVARSLKPPTQRKLVRALHDFAGAADELSFNAGDEIFVINEVLDGWWMGELDGRKGLFPTSYTEVIVASSASSLTSGRRPRVPSRAKSFGGGSTTDSLSLSEDSGSRRPEYGLAGDATEDEEHPFGDHNVPTVLSPSSGHFGYDTESIADSQAEDSDGELGRRLVRPKDEEDRAWTVNTKSNNSLSTAPPLLPRRPTDAGSVRKPPPPPPPRRATTSGPAAAASVTNSLHPSAASSLHTSPQLLATSVSERGASGGGGVGLRVSPFVSSVSLPDSETGPCQNFQQNMFKAHGMCANCFRMHNV
ncbi:BAR-domain-containing protein [Auriscalpium vulgare]|uniref:BAR-domain-containing protein n=1 Tax=Auriscalpium vulgare TaxID=40419 RepID=A0ACB8RN13_9AGAM|nr:BAR-domain-containing protein [Auriscalpium vulgare]